MSRDSLEPLCNQMLRKLATHAALHIELVDAYSFAEAIMYDSSQHSHILNDYLHFCYAKSARSFSATLRLIKCNFREDAFILLRTIYENYLHFWYVLQAPHTLDSFVKAKIGRSTRELEHPKSGTGRHLKVIDRETRELHDYGRSISELAKNGSPRITHEFHELFFEYLCEFTHNHFMSFGGYLAPINPAKFTALRCEKDIEVTMYVLLMSTMWLESFSMFEETDTLDSQRIRRQISSTKELLTKVESELSASGKYEELLAEIKVITSKLGSRIVL